MISTGVKAVIALVAIGGLLLILDNNGTIDLGLGDVTSTTTTTTADLTPGSFSGLLDLNVVVFDTASQEVLDTDVEIDINVYTRDSNGNMQLVNVFPEVTAANMPADEDVSISPEITTIFLESIVETAADYYFDIARIEAQPDVLGHTFDDLNKDGIRAVIFEVDVTGHAEGTGIQPTQQITYYMVDEGSLTITHLADITGLGDVGVAVCRPKWSADMDNDGDGEIVTRFRITANATAIRIDDVWQSNAPQNTTDWEADQEYVSTGDEDTVVTYGKVVMGVTPGEISYAWAQVTTQALDTTIKKGSFIEVYES